MNGVSFDYHLPLAAEFFFKEEKFNYLFHL